MSLENLKITTYEDNVASLPDYPSDAGITAKELKAVFDGRGDKEIKEKFNSLIDEVNALAEALTFADSELSDSIDAKVETINERIAEIIGENLSLRAELDIANTELSEHKENRENPHGVMANQVGTYSSGEIDVLTNDLWEALREHKENSENPHGVTAEKLGALTADALNDEMGKYIPPLENEIGSLRNAYDDLLEDKADKADVYTKSEVFTKAECREIAYNTFVSSSDYQGLLGDVRMLQEKIGDMDAALDEILELQEKYLNGEAE